MCDFGSTSVDRPTQATMRNTLAVECSSTKVVPLRFCCPCYAISKSIDEAAFQRDALQTGYPRNRTQWSWQRWMLLKSHDMLRTHSTHHFFASSSSTDAFRATPATSCAVWRSRANARSFRSHSGMSHQKQAQKLTTRCGHACNPCSPEDSPAEAATFIHSCMATTELHRHLQMAGHVCGRLQAREGPVPERRVTLSLLRSGTGTQSCVLGTHECCLAAGVSCSHICKLINRNCVGNDDLLSQARLKWMCRKPEAKGCCT